jgi:hypothetical protein
MNGMKPDPEPLRQSPQQQYPDPRGSPVSS